MNIRIIEVGPRDGLQNESIPVPIGAKLQFISDLLKAELNEVEATSFVSPKWVPQLADATEVWSNLPPNGQFSALVPNMRGLETALSVGCKRIALFTAASDAFTQKNINMSVQESLDVFGQVAENFRAQIPDGFVRGYISTAFECPYAGRIGSAAVVAVAQKLLEIGVDEISIGDTIGVASPTEVRKLTPELLNICPADKIAYHFHDTRGTAVANVMEALNHGIHTFDSSAGGLGGCPYAKGAGGNLATEDLVYVLEREGIKTGINLELLAQASLPILELVQKPVASRVQQAVLAALPPTQ